MKNGSSVILQSDKKPTSVKDFQEKLVILEVKYESGERTPELIKELFSIYLTAADFYRTKKNNSLVDFFRKKYAKLLEKPETSKILVAKGETISEMETYNSTRRTNQEKQQSKSKIIDDLNVPKINEEHIIDNNLTKFNCVKGKFWSTIDYNSSTPTASSNNKIIFMKDSDLSKKKSCLNQVVKNVDGDSNKDKILSHRSLSNDRVTLQNKLKDRFSVMQEKPKVEIKEKTDLNVKQVKLEYDRFKELSNLKKIRTKEFVENQVKNIISDYQSNLENFNEIVMIQIENQRFNHNELKSIKLQSKQDKGFVSRKKYLVRKGQKFNELYSNLLIGKSVSHEDIIDDILEYIEKSLLSSQNSMNKEIEETISKNIKEMNIAIQELEDNYQEEIQRFEEGGEAFNDVIENLKEEMKQQIELIRSNYDEERQKQIKKIKESFLKSL